MFGPNRHSRIFRVLFANCFATFLTILSHGGRLWAGPSGEYNIKEVASILRVSPYAPAPATPSINNEGVITFKGYAPALPGDIYYGDQNHLSVVKADASVLGATRLPVINDNGDIYFDVLSTFNQYNGIYQATSNGYVPVVTGSLLPYGPDTQIGAFKVSNSGSVAFSAALEGLVSFQSKGTFVESGGTVQTLTSISNSGGLLDTVGPSISDSGIVAFLSLQQPTLVRMENGIQTTVESGYDLISFSVNNAGHVLFSAIPLGDSPVATLVLATSAGLETIATTSAFGPFTNFQSVSLNNHDQIAFYANMANYHDGIYTGTDLLHDKVIAVGDFLNGSTVTQLSFGPNGLNDRGQIAFYAEFANGQAGEFIASVVPEVSDFQLLTVAGLLSVASRLPRRFSNLRKTQQRHVTAKQIP